MARHPEAKRITIIVEAEDGNGLVWECPNVSLVDMNEQEVHTFPEIESSKFRVAKSTLDHVEVALSFHARPDEKSGDIVRYGRTSTAPLGDG